MAYPALESPPSLPSSNGSADLLPISIGPDRLGSIDVSHLYDRAAVANQNSNLFDAPISDGSRDLYQAEIDEVAKSSHVHNFIVSFPRGYETAVGENASLVSGGQA